METEGIIERIILEEVGVGLGTDNIRKNDKSSSSRSGSDSRASTNRDRIRCYKCREYYHFAKNCPTS